MTSVCVPFPKDERSALICAAQNGHADCVRLLVGAGADADRADKVRYALLNVMDLIYYLELIMN